MNSPYRSFGNKNKAITVIIGAIVFILGSYGIQYFITHSLSVEETMLRAAKQMNRSCPYKIDADTQLDSVQSFPNRVFTYYYTLVNLNKEQVDKAAFRKIMEPKIVQEVRTNQKMKYNRKNNITMVYSYSDKSGNFLIKIKVTPATYKTEEK